jgi:hypothetical protein
MAAHEIALLIGGLVLASALVVLMVHAVLWTGRDARQRGFQKVWLLQLLVVVEFPWPWLMYYLVTRNPGWERRTLGAPDAAT